MSTSSERPPSVDALARRLAGSGLPHPLLVDIAREAIAAADPDGAPARVTALQRSMLQPVINATGVLLHTNLGRAPWGAQRDATYANLELDLATGQRGSRQSHAGRLLARAAGAESAMVVNNCAAAVLLVLAALADGRGVAVSRGELVEIGGGFRVPDVMAQSGARLIEVGTTNRTRLADYQRAIDDDEDLALLLHVHRSNYRIIGFTEDPTIAELASTGRTVVADIGSGLLDESCPWLNGDPPGWLSGEPAARQTLAAGADLVMFSGDKLLGGPQAGIIAGRADLVDVCARHPLARAVRPGGLVLGELQTLALAYLDRRGDDIPFWQMAATPAGRLRARAERIDPDRVTAMMSVPGGGTLPGVEIPSFGVSIPGDHTSALRGRDLPILARVADEVTHLDLRTVDPAHDELIAAALQSLG